MTVRTRGVAAAYDAVAEDYARHLPDTRAETALDLALVDAFAAAAAGPGAPVLDAGCGTGRVSRHLADRGLRVQGVDLSQGMVAVARREHPDLSFAVAALTGLPFTDGCFAGVLLWYSVIHTPPDELPLVLAETRRVLRPGGQALVAFQAGTGSRDLSAAYRRYGHQIRLEQYRHDPDVVAGQLQDAGLAEVARLVRRPQGSESDDQAVLLAEVVPRPTP